MKLNRAVTLIGLMLLTGCAAGTGAVIYKVFGPNPIEPKYDVGDQPTLVLVENYQNPAASEIEADRIARNVSDTLKEKGGKTIVEQDKLASLRDTKGKEYRNLTIPAVGKALGATYVIYVNINESDLTADSTQNTVHGKAAGRVRVVSTETGETLWPRDSVEGYEVTTTMSDTQLQEGTSVGSLRSQMLNNISTTIAHLFYKWKPESEAEGDAG